MTQAQHNQTPTLLKVGMYCSELLIVNLAFYLFFSDVLAIGGIGLDSWAYGYMAMTFSMAYCVGVVVRPISFYMRTDKRGSIFANVAIALACMSAFSLPFASRAVSSFWLYHRRSTLPVRPCASLLLFLWL